ncbi:MAG: hypothetical protein ACM3XR_03020 [Bacillota bacterium]
MKSVYLVMTATGTWVSKCIKIYTKSRYNHVSLCLDPGMNEFYSFGRKIRWFPLIGGFIIEHKRHRSFQGIRRYDLRHLQAGSRRTEIQEIKMFR